MKRTGVFGGSFDPVHTGHLLLAEQMAEEAGLDEVIFIPAFRSPFKLASDPAEGEHRLRMLKLAVSSEPKFRTSDIELRRGGASYTSDTLDGLAAEGGHGELFFIMGSDSLLGLDRWYRADHLLKEYSFLVGLRKGDDEEKVRKKHAELLGRFPGARIRLLEIPELEISSSDLRLRHQAGRSLRYAVPDAVLEYIDASGLYTGLLEKLERFAEERQNPHRLAHTRGVVEYAEKYALKFGADPFKAKAAAWFHDNYKEAGALEHGPKAAEELQRLFGISDPDILNAVRYHTTGRPGMSLLEICVKMADLLEPGRSYPEAQELREMADASDDPQRCMYELIIRANDSLYAKGKVPAKISLDAVEYFRSKYGY